MNKIVVKQGNAKDCTLIKFNTYVNIPEKDIKGFNHDYINDILRIDLENSQYIIIYGFTFNDFNKIEYLKVEENKWKKKNIKIY